MKRFILGALFVSLFSMSANAAMTVIIDGPTDVEDTWIWANLPTNNFGGDSTFRIQGPPSSGNAMGLIKFAGIPLGVTIDEAKLYLRTNVDAPGNEGATTDSLSVHRVITPWTDASNWNNFGVVPMTGGVAGTDFDGTPDGSIGPTVNNDMVDLNVTALVQEWSNGVTNQGIMLRGTTGDGVSYVSSEGSFSPRLEITYTAVPEPTAFLMLGLVGLGFGGNRWWKSRKAKE